MAAAEVQGDRAVSSDLRERRLQLRVLGPMEALADSLPLTLGGRKERTALALLIADAGKVVATDDLIDHRGALHAPHLHLEPAQPRRRRHRPRRRRLPPRHRARRGRRLRLRGRRLECARARGDGPGAGGAHAKASARALARPSVRRCCRLAAARRRGEAAGRAPARSGRGADRCGARARASRGTRGRARGVVRGEPGA